MLRAVVVVLLFLWPSTGRAETRIALLIGNQGYKSSVGPLKNPHKDIELIGAALRSVGFKVSEVKDADYREVEAAIKRHVAGVRRGGQGTISFLYYSGHGAADPDTKINYLIPVDVANADDEELWNYSLNLNTVVEGLRAQAPGATHYVVFDACRNELNLTRKGQKALADKGFVPMAYTPGVLVAYATAPGRTASDIGVGGGTYAKALANEIVKPGIDSMLVFTRVARRVQQEIGQDPFMSASTMPEVYFAAAGAQPQPITPTAPQKSETSEVERTWPFVKDTNSTAVLETFIQRYKDTIYAELASARLAELKKKQQQEVDAVKKRTDEEARAKVAAERQRLAMLQQEEEKRRAEAAAKKPATPPQASPSPQSAWVKLCEKASAVSKDKRGNEEKKDLNICLTHHERLDGNTGMVLVSAAVRQVEGQDKQHFMVMVPLGMLVQPGMRASLYPKDAWEKIQKNEKIDESKLKQITLAYTLCHPAGCTAETEATAEFIGSLKTSGGLVVVSVKPDGAAVSFPVPLTGFETSYAGAPVDNKTYGEARKTLMNEIAARQKQLEQEASQKK